MTKEQLYEALGNINENRIEEVQMTMKKKNRYAWVKWGAMVACLAIVAVVGISIQRINQDDISDSNNISTPVDGERSSMKPVINFEGVVAEVENDKVTLTNGQIIYITKNTIFAGDMDTNNAVNTEIQIGNFIQGYTADDSNRGEITANKIWTNERQTNIVGKRIINFEGRVIKVEENTISLENGKTVKISEDTLITTPDGTLGEITEGNYIQGYAENAEDSEINATYILITPL